MSGVDRLNGADGMDGLRRVAAAQRGAAVPSLLLGGLGLAIWLRVTVGAPVPAVSARGAFAFAGVLALLTAAAGTSSLRADRRSVLRGALWGVAGAAVLVLPPLLLQLTAPARAPDLPFVPWAATITTVATAEEVFLRGALYDAFDRLLGPAAAIAVTAAGFTALHLPLYGWHSVPLNLAVGLWLSALRRTTGGCTAPVLAHVLADLATWWLH